MCCNLDIVSACIFPCYKKEKQVKQERKKERKTEERTKKKNEGNIIIYLFSFSFVPAPLLKGKFFELLF